MVIRLTGSVKVKVHHNATSAPVTTESEGWDPKNTVNKEYKTRKAVSYWVLKGRPAKLSKEERKTFSLR